MVLIAHRDDPVVDEVTSTLREWHQIWLSLYLDNQSDLFDRVGTLLLELLDLRDEILQSIQPSASSPVSHDSISQKQLINELKTTIINKIDLGNRLLGLDLVLRDSEFRPVDPIKLSPIKLYHLHKDAAYNSSAPQNLMNNVNNGNLESTASTTCSSHYSSSQIGSESQYFSNSYHNQNSYHLQLSVQQYQSTLLPPDELLEIYFSVVEIDSTSSSSNQISHISERYLVKIKNEQIVDGVPNTIFANIGQIKDREIAILVQVYRVGKMILADQSKTSFGKQSSSSNMPMGIYSDLTSASSKFLSDLPRSRHSTISGIMNLHSNYRRPFGATFLILSNHQGKNLGSLKELKMSARVCSSQNEMEFSSLNDLYLRKNQAKSNQYQHSLKLDLSLKFLMGPLDALPRMTTFDLNDYCLTEKRGFPDVVMPGDFKNDLYFTLESAEFEKGGKSISKNIEASISLIDRSGLVLDKCIVPASNCDKLSSYKSCIFYHSNTPRWNEGIKINVPLAEFDKSHIRIEFRHCSTKDREKKFLGFSFLPLSDEDGTVISDDSHELFLYKCDFQSLEDETMNLRKYASLPHGPSSKLARLNNNNSGFGSKQCLNQNFTHSNREIVTVSTFLLSTKLTQNSTLLNLLKWRELVKRNNQDFEDTLNKVLVLKGEEIVKFLQDILDTLFDTFTLYLTSDNNCSALIFKVLVHIFLLLDDPKYQHFKPVLDTYASAHFSATLVYKGLLACVKKCLEYSSIVEWHAPIQRCFKAIKYVFQFIVQSRILYSKATGEQNDEHFLNDLRHLFKLFETMLSNDDKKAIPLQETFLESFPGALEQLMRVMEPHELASVVTSLPGSVGFNLPPQLSRAKLIFMRGVANSSLLMNQDVRMQISEIFCRHLMIYITNSERLELCYEVLETLIVNVHDNHWPSIHRLYCLTVKNQMLQNDDQFSNHKVMSIGEITVNSKSGMIQANQLDLALTNVSKELEPFVKLMDPLLILLDKLVRDLNNDRPIIQRYCNCLLTILKLMGRLSFGQFTSRLQIDYRALCELFKSLRAVYFRDWSIMQLTSHAILEHPIDEISKMEFNKQPNSYIHLMVDFITHPTLQLESFSEKKKENIMSVFGDLRLKFSSQLIKFWKNLSKARISEMIPTSLQAILDAALLPNDDIQRMLIPIFYDMMDADDYAKSNLRQIERCLIDHLDLFMNLDRGNMKFIKNFETILTDLIEAKLPPWKAQGIKSVSSFTQLMHLLVNYRQSLEVSGGKSKQMICLVDLLGFHRDQEKIDIYLKYLFKLCDIHLDANHYTEAAFTLKMYADELRWCNKNLSALDGFRPDEQEWKRKEVLYHRIIHYFDLGKCWEESISLCKELASFYENYLVDYEKVSNTLKRLAQLLDNILTEHRPEIEYFRVEFLGSEQPEYMKGKELIYRGGEYERLAAFIQRISSEFPQSRVINTKEKKSLFGDKLIKSSALPGQYLVISNVKPVPSLQDTFKLGHRIINDKIIQYYLNNRLDTFSHDLPIVKGEQKDKSGELNIRNLWVGRCILKLKKQLPDILPWAEVISRDYIEINPIANAIETISSMNLELSKLILSYTKEPSKQLSPLTMRLQGVLEAAVNGGPAVIINAFFKRPRQDDSQTDQQLTSESESLVKLRDLIKQQFTILEQGLGLHLNLAPPEVMPLHTRLSERLEALTRSFIEETALVENNYETLCQHAATARNIEKISTTTASSNETHLLVSSSLSANSGLDEIDGFPSNNVQHRDANGNTCLMSDDDQIYSHPSETNPVVSPANHHEQIGKSGSPLQNIITGSSSLSTLTILSNMPLNHRARMSITPSKEMNATLYRGSTGVSRLEQSNELRNRAARRLTYDSSRLSSDLNKSLTLNSRRLATNSNSKQEQAPPLPPRIFSHDKHSNYKVQPPITKHSQQQSSKANSTAASPSLSGEDSSGIIIPQQRATANN